MTYLTRNGKTIGRITADNPPQECIDAIVDAIAEQEYKASIEADTFIAIDAAVDSRKIELAAADGKG